MLTRRRSLRATALKFTRNTIYTNQLIILIVLERSVRSQILSPNRLARPTSTSPQPSLVAEPNNPPSSHRNDKQRAAAAASLAPLQLLRLHDIVAGPSPRLTSEPLLRLLFLLTNAFLVGFIVAFLRQRRTVETAHLRPCPSALGRGCPSFQSRTSAEAGADGQTAGGVRGRARPRRPQ